MSTYKYSASVKYNIKDHNHVQCYATYLRYNTKAYEMCVYCVTAKGQQFLWTVLDFSFEVNCCIYLYNDSECNGWWKGIE
jgi:hypothetical protein